jgi:hypothetical protein
MQFQVCETGSCPRARTSGLVTTEAADEVLVYDTDRHHIHHLNITTAAVWRHCDGERAVGDLARLAGQDLGASVDEATVRLALTKLDDAGLLTEPLAAELRLSRMSRRTFMQRAGVAGALAVPAIVSTTAPAAATHDSKACRGCNRDRDCKSGCPDKCDSDGVCKDRKCGSGCVRDSQCADLATCTDCRGGECKEPRTRISSDSTESTGETEASTLKVMEVEEPTATSTKAPVTETPTETATETPTATQTATATATETATGEVIEPMAAPAESGDGPAVDATEPAVVPTDEQST